MLTTKSHAAQILGIGRKTVQRYARQCPDAVSGGKVDTDLLIALFALRKMREPRGCPLGHKRANLPLRGHGKKPSARVCRTLFQRLETIKREIDAMTDDDQLTLLRVHSIYSLFRRENVAKVAAEQQQHAASTSIPHDP